MPLFENLQTLRFFFLDYLEKKKFTKEIREVIRIHFPNDSFVELDLCIFEMKKKKRQFLLK